MNKKPAFSIIEVLVAITLGVILMGASYSLYYLATKTLSNSTNDFEIRQNARIALERLSRDLRQSETIVSDLPETDSGLLPTEIKFQDGHITAKIQYIDYYLKSNSLYKKYSHYSFTLAPTVWVSLDTKDGNGNSPTETVDSDQLMAEDIQSLSFWGKTTITINLTVQKGRGQESYQTVVLGRNI